MQSQGESVRNEVGQGKFCAEIIWREELKEECFDGKDTEDI